MPARYRMHVSLALILLCGLTINNPAAAQGRGKVRVFSGGSNNNSNDNNNSDNSQSGNRRNRNRDDDEDNNGFFGGSDAQKIQQAIQGIQGNSGQKQPFGGGQQGLQFKNNQQWQGNNPQWQGNLQGNGQNRRANRRNNMQSWALQFGGSTPFSVQWYEDHPQAWHHHHHHDDDAWKVATAAGVLAWLGWGVQPYVPGPTVVYEPLPVETIYLEGQPIAIDPNAPGEWMTLGVYSLVTGGGDDGTRLLQLVVDKHGNVRGSYYDTVSNTSHNLSGRIHQPSQQVQWTLDTNKQMVFFTPLSQLTQSQGVVWVKFPSGQKQQWQLARMENSTN